MDGFVLNLTAEIFIASCKPVVTSWLFNPCDVGHLYSIVQLHNYKYPYQLVVGDISDVDECLGEVSNDCIWILPVMLYASLLLVLMGS